jgi:hypothetical protein
MTAPAIFYVGYGLPFKVFYYGSQPLYSLLSSSSQYSQLSIESEIRSRAGDEGRINCLLDNGIDVLVLSGLIERHAVGHDDIVGAR